MKKLVAIETIKGMFGNIIYAHKHEEVELVLVHDEEINMYRNVRTKELFHCRKERVGEVEVSDIFLFVETEEKKQKNSTKKKSAVNTGQQELF